MAGKSLADMLIQKVKTTYDRTQTQRTDKYSAKQEGSVEKQGKGPCI